MAKLTIKIPNWEKFNPRSDRANYSWFRFQNTYFSDQAVFMLNDAQVSLHIFCICELSKKNAAEVDLRSEYIASLRRQKERDIINNLQHLDYFGLIELWVDGVRTAESRHEDGMEPSLLPATNERTNDTNDTNVPTEQGSARAEFDFESLYKKYPRKEGKAKGLALCKAQITAEYDFELLSRAIDRYTQHCLKSGTEAKFVKHFSTFMGSWKEWADPETGSTLKPQPKLSAWAQEMLKREAEEKEKQNAG